MNKKCVALFALSGWLGFAGSSYAADWVAGWGASPAPQFPVGSKNAEKLKFENQTLREIVHLSIGGKSIRIRLSNAYGKDSVAVGAVHVAQRGENSGVTKGTDRAVTFSGRSNATLPPDALLLSDPIAMDVKAGADLAISIFLPKATPGAGIHYSAQQTSYVAAGNGTAAAELEDPSKIESWAFLTGVDVQAPQGGTIVAFGDSITDGARSSMDTNHRWPDILAARLAGHKGKQVWGVLDAGIGGNRVLNDPTDNVGFGVNALARYSRDVLSQPNVKYVIIMEGINDLGHPGTSAPLSQTASVEEIIAGLQQMVERAHEQGIKVIGATLTPFEGTAFPGYFSPEKEVKRKAINRWIRGGKAFDGVVDFDKVTQNPNSPDRMNPAYDSGDHLHPNDAGYKAMGEAVDLALFR